MKKVFLFLFFVLHLLMASAQQGHDPFWNDVQKFKAQDSIAFPPSNQILFIGSSSFTFWKDVQDYFPRYKILNRAFGGSQLSDVIRYRYEIVYPYQPRQIVMYCGENDFAASDTVTPETVFARFVTFYTLMRARYPAVPFAYVSMKPSPSRVHLLEKMKSANDKIAAFLRVQKNAAYINVYTQMLNPDGKVSEDIFLEDRLHMNANGYKIWQRVIKPYLKK